MEADQTAGKERTLVRDTAILREFDASESPDLLVLYYHLRDRSFDCFNGVEYHEQLLRYYKASMSVVEVVPRTICGNDYLLVCLRDAVSSRNAICELAFSVQRQFVGISMLVKKRCFNPACNKRTSMKCSVCRCACFCSKECLKIGWPVHKALCKLVKAAGPPPVDEETLNVEL
jgi:hypothetical protein